MSSASSGAQHLAFFSTEFSAKYKNIAMIITCVICGLLRKMQGLNLKTVLILDNYNEALVRYLLKFLTSFLRVQSEPPSLEGLQNVTIKLHRLYMTGTYKYLPSQRDTAKLTPNFPLYFWQLGTCQPAKSWRMKSKYYMWFGIVKHYPMNPRDCQTNL